MTALKPAGLEDFDIFLSMKSDANNVAWGGFIKAPDREFFFDWYRKQLDVHSRRILLLLWDEDGAVGYCSIDRTDSQEISYGVLSQYVGRGYGTTILMLAESYCIGTEIMAWVADDNYPSIRCFEKNGYRRTEDNMDRNLPLLGGLHTFNKWIKKLS